jgi:class 3 adenylate cyclase/tetratricopeptide (TPR) repeat protein
VDVAAWLDALALGQYTEAFRENDIDADTLPDLTAEDLKELGVSSLGHRKKLLAAIAETFPAQPESADGAAAASPQPGERRQVTVLFADLTGFTKLSNELGAEETHGLLNRYFEAVDGIVEGYGGNVDKHIGDNVMAVFGAPVAHGNDPERAVRAAGDIHQAMQALSGDLGRELQAHIGIASGQVVASGTGSAAHREYTVTGETVNLASRLQDKAKAGETLISDTVCRAVSDLVDCADLGEIEVKGFAAPIRVWRTDGLRRRASREHLSLFVGRRPELRQFTAITEECLETGAGQSMLVRGEAGIGKTRLMEEFTRIAEDQGFACHRVLVLDFGVGKGQDAVRALVRSLLGIPAGLGKSRRIEAAVSAIKEGMVDSDQRVFLNDLLDLPQPTDLRALYDAMDNAIRNSGKQQAVAQLIARFSQSRPIMIMVEDVHWADSLTLDHLAGVASTVASCPAILVMTSRVEGDPLDQTWRALLRGSPLTTIDVGPLRDTEAMEIATGFVGANSPFMESCIERAEGNPLFLEQLLRNVEEGAEEDVPDTIQSLVLARMDRLATQHKQALQAASVIGQRYALEALRHLLDDPAYDCGQLVAHHLVSPEGDGYLFAHALIRDGVYASLLDVRRRELHLKAAQWFAEQDLVLHAQHLERAADAAAPRAYLAAARAQADTYHFDRALQLVEQGLGLAGEAEDRCDLALVQGEFLHDMGKVQDSMAAHRVALDIAPDDARCCRAWIGLAAGMRITDRYDEALKALDEAEGAATAEGLTEEQAHIHHLRGNIYFPLGRTEDCAREHELSLKFALEAESPEAEARALGGLGDANYAFGRMKTAHDYFKRCVALAREHGLGRIEVANWPMATTTSRYLMRWHEGLAETEASLDAARRVGYQRAELIARSVTLNFHIQLGQLEHIEEELRELDELIQRLDAKRFQPYVLEARAALDLAAGNREAAVRKLEQAVEICRGSDFSFAGPPALAHLARMTDDPDQRRAALKEGESVLRQGAVGHSHLWFYSEAMEACLMAGEWEEVERYATALETYTRPEPLPWCDFCMAWSRALAAFGRGRRDKATIQELRRLRDEAASAGLQTALPALDEALAGVENSDG